MTGFVGMSREVFNANEKAIAAQVCAIVASQDSRRRYRILAVYDNRTGELVAEAFQTSYGPVIWYWDGQQDDTLGEHRQGSRRLDPLTGDPGQPLVMFGRARAYYTGAKWFCDRIAAGHRTVRVSRPTHA